MNAPAKVAKHKPAPCSGLLGRRCTCGLIHTNGGEQVDTDDEFWSELAQAIVGVIVLICAGLAIITALSGS